MHNRSEQCPNELAIAGYLAGTVTPEERERLEEHFADCPECCRELAESIRAEPGDESAIEGAARAKAWSRIQAVLEQAREQRSAERGAEDSGSRKVSGRPPNVIVLRPTAPAAAQAKTYALAAATDATEVAAMPTYASENRSVIGRFLRDEARGELSLFLITEHMDRLRDAVIHVESPQADYRFEGAPDPDGVVALGTTPVLDPNDIRIELHFPTARLPLRPDA